MRIDADELRDLLLHSYANGREDYPQYALTPWDDRNRYTKWVLDLIDILEEKASKAVRLSDPRDDSQFEN